jgi:hypothetical protein
MTTQKMTEANRANAQHSTGPQTPEGKQRSSRNALKHGLFSRQILMWDEDAGELEQFRQDMLESLRPVGAMEEMLADRIVSESWRLQRADRLEAKEFNRTEYWNIENVTLLEIYQVRIERSMYRAIKELERRQEARRGLERQQEQERQQESGGTACPSSGWPCSSSEPDRAAGCAHEGPPEGGSSAPSSGGPLEGGAQSEPAGQAPGGDKTGSFLREAPAGSPSDPAGVGTPCGAPVQAAEGAAEPVLTAPGA